MAQTPSIRSRNRFGNIAGGSLRWFSERFAFRVTKRNFFLFILPGAFAVGLATGCVTYIPVEEYTMARAAYEAAKDADSARFAPALWFNTEQAYRSAQKAFRDRRYEEAKVAFGHAQEVAEQAENSARLSRAQSGEVIP